MTADRDVRSLERVPTVQSGVLLFEQLRRQGFEESDLGRVRAAYGSAMALFAGRMHWSGKLHIAHAVGVASALAGIGADGNLVAAGVLHTAYRWGDFGSLPGRLPIARQRLQREVGVQAEAYVHSFSKWRWSQENITAVSTKLQALDPIERGSVLTHLANDLDNMRDRALLYSLDSSRRLETMRRKGPLLIEVAEKLGYPALAAALAAALEENLDAAVPPELGWHLAAVAIIPPESSKKKIGAALSASIAQQLRRVRNILRG
jgi:(p)ppGpp synthase/HD superfamily hydrolase